MGKGQKSKLNKKSTPLKLQFKLAPLSLEKNQSDNSETGELSETCFEDDFPVYGNSTDKIGSFGDCSVYDINDKIISEELPVSNTQRTTGIGRTSAKLPEDYPQFELMDLPYPISKVKRALDK